MEQPQRQEEEEPTVEVADETSEPVSDRLYQLKFNEEVLTMIERLDKRIRVLEKLLPLLSDEEEEEEQVAADSTLRTQ